MYKLDVGWMSLICKLKALYPLNMDSSQLTMLERNFWHHVLRNSEQSRGWASWMTGKLKADGVHWMELKCYRWRTT